MANLWFDIDTGGSPLMPFLGVGVGIGRITLDSRSHAMASGVSVDQEFPESSAVAFAFQAGAGLGFDLGAGLSLNLSAIFRHAKRHLAAPIRRRPCDVCGDPLGTGNQVRHERCRAEAKAKAKEREYAARKRRRDAEAWLRRGDARWSSDPELRRQRQAAGLCVVCAHDRPADRHWCCSREHEVLRRHTLRRVLS